MRHSNAYRFDLDLFGAPLCQCVFICGCEKLHARGKWLEVVPLVPARPRLGQAARRCVVARDDLDHAILIREVCTGRGVDRQRRVDDTSMRKGGIPNLPDDVTREAYSHEVSSAGFWPGGGPTDYAAFYSYAYPAPAGFDAACVRPAEAFYAASAGEFLLPYEAMRTSSDPEAALHEFLQSTYDAAADAGR